MQAPRKLALIVSYYLSRFNREAVANLGFNSFKGAFEETAKILGVKENYVKLRRDEFDAAFPWRIGWKRKMDKRTQRVMELFKDLEEPDLRDIVKGILYDVEYRESEELQGIETLLYSIDSKNKVNRSYIVRGPTGRLAEGIFIKNQKNFAKPLNGSLKDTRDLGTGYDFEISNDNKIYYVEVKGLRDTDGGILFTSKEWKVAQNKKGDYFLVIIRNTNDILDIEIIQNPAIVLNPKKNIYTSVQIQYSVSNNQLKALNHLN